MKQHIKATLDESGEFYTLQPLAPGNRMTISMVFRAIRNTTGISWKKIGEFSKIHKQSDAFSIAYGSKAAELIKKYGLSDYLVIDSEENKAYYYNYENKPESIPVQHVGPTITSSEDATQKVVVDIPEIVTSRVKVSDPLNRILSVKFEVTNGKLIGFTSGIGLERVSSIATKAEAYGTTGRATTINRLLKNIRFVAIEEGSASITITVDDGADEDNSTASVTINMLADPGKAVVVPTIEAPEEFDVTINQRTKITPPITVEDAENRLLQFTMTPIGCRLLNIKSYAHGVNNGENFSRLWTAEEINYNLSELEVYAVNDAAQLVIDVRDGVTTIHAYTIFNVTNPGSIDEDIEQEEENVVTYEEEYGAQASIAATPILEPVSVQDVVAEEDDEQAVMGTPIAEPASSQGVTEEADDEVVLLVHESKITGAAGSIKPMNVNLMCDVDKEVSVTLIPTNVKLRNILEDGTDITKETTISGTVSEINTILSENAKVVVTNAKGSIYIKCGDDNEATIAVEPIVVATATDVKA